MSMARKKERLQLYAEMNLNSQVLMETWSDADIIL